MCACWKTVEQLKKVNWFIVSSSGGDGGLCAASQKKASGVEKVVIFFCKKHTQYLPLKRKYWGASMYSFVHVQFVLASGLEWWKSQDFLLKEKSGQLFWKRFAGCCGAAILLLAHQSNHIQWNVRNLFCATNIQQLGNMAFTNYNQIDISAKPCPLHAFTSHSTDFMRLNNDVCWRKMQHMNCTDS